MFRSIYNLNYWENEVLDIFSCCGFIVVGYRGIILWDIGVEIDSGGVLIVR